MPTKYTFAQFSYLVNQINAIESVSLNFIGADSHGKFLKHAEISLVLSAPGGIINTRSHGSPFQSYLQ